MLVFLTPKHGAVVRLRHSPTGSAWVSLDTRHPIDCAHPFPADDHRATHVLTYPEFCEVLAHEGGGR
jgi:hypothetical protein